MKARLPKQAAQGKVHDAIARGLQVVFDELLAGTDLRGRMVLDAGCGYGAFFGWAAARGANVVSCDIAEKLVRGVGAVASSCGVVGDACNLRFKDDALEIVISSEMIEHTARPPGAIRELVRVLRPGGILVITTPNRAGQGVVRLASYLHLRPFHGLENLVRRSEFRAACTAPDLDVLEHISFHAWPFQFVFSGLPRRVNRRFGAGPLASLMINQAVLARKAGRNQALTTGPRASRVC